MTGMAQALQSGLDRSNLFLQFFTTEIEGDDWSRELAGFPNTALWTLGHLAFTRAYFYEMLTGKKIYEDSWKSLFNYGSPHANIEQLLPPEQCWDLAKAGYEHLSDFLANSTEEGLLSAPTIESNSFPTKLSIYIHLTHHESHHTGCLSMMRRVMGKEKLV